MLPKSQRLELFVARLNAAEPAGTQEAAFLTIAAALKAVEDEHSGVPDNPANWRTDGRMYPPQSDMAKPDADRPGVTVYRSRSHRTFIARNGAFAIENIWSRNQLVEKIGRDGVGLPPREGGGKA